MRGRLTTPDGKREYAKRITVAEGPFGNMKVNKRWNQLNHRGLKMVKGECLLHAIGHNLGVICKNVSIDRIESLESIQILSNSFENSMVIPYHPPIFGQGVYQRHSLRIGMENSWKLDLDQRSRLWLGIDVLMTGFFDYVPA